jgi:preprotein translocase subunit SecA
MRREVIEEVVRRHIPPNAYAEQWNTQGLHDEINGILGLDLPLKDWAAEEGIADEEIIERLNTAADEKSAAKVAEFGPEMFRQIEKMVLLQTLDHLWREHLVTLEHLRQVIGFRAYGQRDPLNEYKTEAFVLFESLLARLREAVTGQLMHVQMAPAEEQPLLQPAELPPMEAHHIDPNTGLDEFAMVDAALSAEGRAPPQERRAPVRNPSGGRMDPNNPASWGKVSRNAPCPCGSGKKYKHCHGKLD